MYYIFIYIYNYNMAKIRLTESQLNQIVAESVKRVLREGELWDTIKGVYTDAKNDKGFDDITTPEFKNFIKGGNLEGGDDTNYEMYRRNRDAYKRAEKGSNERRNAAHDAVLQRPGVIGKLGRSAAVGAAKLGSGVRHFKDYMNNKVGY